MYFIVNYGESWEKAQWGPWGPHQDSPITGRLLHVHLGSNGLGSPIPTVGLVWDTCPPTVRGRWGLVGLISNLCEGAAPQDKIRAAPTQQWGGRGVCWADANQPSQIVPPRS